MRRVELWRLSLVGLLGLLIWALFMALGLAIASGQAPDGAETALELSLPTVDVAVGDRIEAAVRLADSNGAPIADAEIVFTQSLGFMNAAGDVELARVTTDENGRAVAILAPRSETEMVVNARFEGDNRYLASDVSQRINVLPGPAQYREEAGIRVPGINVSLLVAILGAVWTTYFVVMILVLRIARRGSLPPVGEGGPSL